MNGRQPMTNSRRGVPHLLCADDEDEATRQLNKEMEQPDTDWDL